MNIENARKLVSQLERLPDEKFWMKSWIAHPEEFGLFDVPRSPECGTVGCIAGWAFILNGGEAAPGMRPKGSDIVDFATDFLELSMFAASDLFMGDWSKKPIELITRTEAIAELNRMIAAAS